MLIKIGLDSPRPSLEATRLNGLDIPKGDNGLMGQIRLFAIVWLVMALGQHVVTLRLRQI